MKPKHFQNFDDRANNFTQNIYNSDKGKIRLSVLQNDLKNIVINTNKPLKILDVGCGSGQMSIWCHEFNHEITAFDISEKLLASAKQNEIVQKNIANKIVNTEKDINWIQADIFQILPELISKNEKFDLILCHAVLEWVDDSELLLKYLTSLLSENGKLSLMFFNGIAREFIQLVYGNFDLIDKSYQVKKKVKLNPHNAYNPFEIKTQLEQLGVNVESISGVRVFNDLISEKNRAKISFTEILNHELRVRKQDHFWQMARYVHFICG